MVQRRRVGDVFVRQMYVPPLLLLLLLLLLRAAKPQTKETNKTQFVAELIRQ